MTLKSIKNLHPIVPMVAFATIAYIVQMIFGLAPIEAADTTSYCTASRNEIFCDDFRFPVYPFLLYILQLPYVADVLLTPGGKVLVALQWVAWVIGALGVLRVCRQYGCSTKVCHIAMALLLLPSFWLYTAVVLPEEFCAVALIWLVERSVAYLAAPSKSKALHIGIITFVLIMLKPVFVYLLAVMAVFWLVAIASKRYRRSAVVGLVAVMLCGVGVLSYMYAIERKCNFNGVITRAQVINDYYMLREHDIIDANDIVNDDLRRIYLAEKTDYGNYYREFGEMGLLNSYLLVQDVKKAHPGALTKIRLEHFVTTLFHNVLYLEHTGYDYTKYIYFPFAAVWVVLLAFVAMTVRRWRARRRFPLADYLLAAILGGGYVATLWGAMNDWGRLLVPFGFVLLVLTVVTVNRAATALRGAA